MHTCKGVAIFKHLYIIASLLQPINWTLPMKAKIHDQPNTLITKTIELVNAYKGSLPELYKETDISFYWLRKFKAGEFQNPSVNRVQWLYEYLSGKKLDL